MTTSYITRGNTHIFWHAELTSSYWPRKRARVAARKDGIKNGLEVPREVRRVDSGILGKPNSESSNEDDVVLSTDHSKMNITQDQTLKSDEPETRELKASSVQVLKFLLSNAALEFCQSANQIDTRPNAPDNAITYNQLLTPFEELLCAVIISRPIPHRVALSIIQMVLNAPYALRNPVAIKTAGPQKVRFALKRVQLQHKDLPTEEADLIADAISYNTWHNDLWKLRKMGKDAREAERDVLRRSISGMAKHGLDVFYRRIQWQWDEMYPFADAGARVALEKQGLPRRAEGIAKMIEVRWDEVRLADEEHFSEEERRKRAFVVLLERAVTVDVEGRFDEVQDMASQL